MTPMTQLALGLGLCLAGGVLVMASLGVQSKCAAKMALGFALILLGGVLTTITGMSPRG